MCTIACQIGNGFQNNKCKETHAFIEDFTLVHEMIKFQKKHLLIAFEVCVELFSTHR